MMGSLGEAFQKAPKADVKKLLKVEREKTPPEPLETEELIAKFTRERGDDFYEKFVKVRYSLNYFLVLKKMQFCKC